VGGEREVALQRSDRRRQRVEASSSRADVRSVSRQEDDMPDDDLSARAFGPAFKRFLE
jgi:hypothetical protein